MGIEFVEMGTCHGSRNAPMGHCIWEYNGSDWTLKKSEAVDGGVPGSPPTQPGRFKGQLRVTPCIAAGS